jgi:3,4-dihydroxy 2-butanone 4-phosphate synthase/GTP cyclohydrolase II
MARLPELMKVAKKFKLKIVSIEALVAYRMQHDSLIQKKEDFNIKTRFGEFRLRAYLQLTNKKVHIALTKGQWNLGEQVLTRINSSYLNQDILSTLTSNPDEKLQKMFEKINAAGKGAIIFIQKEVDSFEMLKRLQLLKDYQNKNELRAPKIEMDAKDFGIGAQILHDIDINKLQLMSNEIQAKRVGLIGYGLEITDYVGY